jgi:hypothetical protein
LSISTALSIALNSSNDENETIKEVLGYNHLNKDEILAINKRYLDYLSEIKPEDSVFINLENKLFNEKNLKLDDNFKTELDEFFNCKSNSYEFPSSINKVNNLISEPKNHINSTDQLVLINDFSFNAKSLDYNRLGEGSFDEEQDDLVKNPIEILKIEKICFLATFKREYFEDLKFETIQIQYKKGLIMTIIFPLGIDVTVLLIMYALLLIFVILNNC